MSFPLVDGCSDTSEVVDHCREFDQTCDDAIIEAEGERAEEVCSPEIVETALRWLAIRKDGGPLGFLLYAIDDPSSDSAVMLGCLVRKTASMPSATPEARALALWGLLLDEIGKIGTVGRSRRRGALIAAFRLRPEPGSGLDWEPTLDGRFGQLKELPGVFKSLAPSTTTPMHKAWKRALTDRLAPCLSQRLESLGRDGSSWSAYEEIGRALSAGFEDEVGFSSPVTPLGRRAPSRGAQPVFMELMIVTVTMTRKAATRRITERNIVACEDGVETYRARALTGWTDELAPIPINAIWGCRVETSPGRRPGDPMMVDLRFPRILRKGDRHRFVSEAIEDDLDEERLWINVDVDHHGIAAGVVGTDGEPTSGLTLRVRFDDVVPEACWWYAEQTDYERYLRPPDGDRHLLEVRHGSVEHNFLELCHPREAYGIAFRWPQEIS
ncbi:hypothetical protein [Amycolatopsis sp. cmx-11-12]|uniref:hypothetical protein n=1 Tax=Amycolatopsis sp. cmx-11-12 TaxID=2785795 RepID=UPI003917D081